MSEQGGRRPEIDGLRAIAVLAVVAFHARVPGFAGGFVGVDVFFVISGFLITGLLIKEFEGSGTIRLSAFWARRFRRILPALVAVMVLTVVVGYIILLPWERRQLLESVRAVALSGGNFYFWSRPSGYFATVTAAQPLLHTWSLGVEEQFYLLWPVMVLVALRRGGRRMLGVLIGVIVVMSFSASAILTSTSLKAAFYLPQSRAWELLLGAALALWMPLLGRVPDSVKVVGGWVGVAAIALCTVFYSDATHFPGVAALGPTLGAAAVLLAGTSPSRLGATRVLSWKALTTIGLWSYSWYLLHWPALVFLRAQTQSDALFPAVLACVGSLAAAALSWKFIEQRFVPRKIKAGTATAGRATAGRSTNRALVFGLSAAAVVVASSTVLISVDTSSATTKAGDFIAGLSTVSSTASSTAFSTVTTGAPSTSSSTTTTAAGFDWSSSEGLTLLQQSRTLLEWPCVNFALNRSFDPKCQVIPGTRSIVVVGDSHAGSVGPAAAALATERGLGLALVGQPQCPVVPGIEVYLNGTLYKRCVSWVDAVIKDLQNHHGSIAAVVLAARSSYYFPSQSIAQSVNLGEASIGAGGVIADDAQAQQLWEAGIHLLATQLGDLGVPLLLVHGEPELSAWPSDCLARNSLQACGSARSLLDPYRQSSFAAENAAVAGVKTAVAVDPYAALCDATFCPPAQGTTVLYRDDNHLTPQGSLLLLPMLRAALDTLGVH